MYRVIFIFDLAELFYQLDPWLRELLHRNRHTPLNRPGALQRLRLSWVRRELDRRLYLQLNPDTIDFDRSALDAQFLSQTGHLSDEFYRRLSRAIYPNAHPCLESPCAVLLDHDELRLHFAIA